MKVSEFARDFAQSPDSEDTVVVNIDGIDYDIAAVQFEEGKVTLLTGETPETPTPVALAEQTAQDQAAFSEDGNVPGHADVMHEVATGEGIASDLRGGEVKTEPDKSSDWADRGQEYHSGPEQPVAPIIDEQVTDDSGT